MEKRIQELDLRLAGWQMRREHFKNELEISIADVRKDRESLSDMTEESMYGSLWRDEDIQSMYFNLSMALQADRYVQRIQAKIKKILEAH